MESDLFEVTPYVKALSEFIRESPTPITIALQGGWGTGKTSFMNMIIEELEPVEIHDEVVYTIPGSFSLLGKEKIERRIEKRYSAPIITVKFNTWQYSQFHLQDSLATSFLNYMIEKLSEGVKDIDQYKEKAIEMIKFIGLVSANIALSPYGAQISQDMFSKNPTLDPAKAIESLKASLTEIIQKKLAQHNSDDTRLVIFIDDLDRLNPAVTVNLLEVIKLFLDVEGCVFVLAVDNRVIEEGIALTKETSKEKTKSFLDKMIQVPFKIPIENYDYKHFLKDNISLFNEKYQNHPTIPYEELENLIRYSVGSNPRAMKRLINNYILNEKVNKRIYKQDADTFNESEQALLLSVICMQLAFQPLYMTLLNSEDDMILKVINKELSEDDPDKEFTELLSEKILDNRFYEMYDEDLKSVQADIPRYDIFITLLHRVLLKIHGKSSTTEIELLEPSEIKKFIEIMQRAQMTSGSQNITEVKKEKELGEAGAVTISEFYKNLSKYQPIDKPINFFGKPYSPKEGFLEVMNHYLTEHNKDQLSDASFLKTKKVSKIIYMPLLPEEEQIGNKYGTVTIGDSITIGYHFSSKESIRQLYKLLNDVLMIENIDDKLTITAMPIIN